MKTKTCLFFVVFLFNFTLVYAQEIAIPYRDGNKWGMCNQIGKILIEPKYDALNYKNNYDSDFRTFNTKINDKIGLIINGEIIFEAKYSEIYELNDNYVLITEENNNKTTEIYTKQGINLLKKPIIEIIFSTKITTNLLLYHVLNTDFTESVFLINAKTLNIEQWLYEDYYSVSIIPKTANDYQLVFNSKKTQSGVSETHIWKTDQQPFTKTTSLIYQTENSYLKQFYNKANYKRNEYTKGSSNGTGNGLGTGNNTEEVVEDYGYNYTVAEPNDEKSTTKYIPKKYFNTAFKIENDKLILEKTQTNTKENNKKSELLKLKIPIKNIELIECLQNISNKDSVQNFRNLVFYKNKNKQGIIFSSNSTKYIEFDTIIKKFNNISDYTNDSNEITFLIGNKNSKNNQFQYSLYSNIKGLVFPIQFDELKPLQLQQYNYGKTVYQSKIGQKYGLIDFDGKVLLKTEYELFEKPNNNNHTNEVTKNFVLKKNKKYGLIFQIYGTNKTEIIDTLFDYEIDDVFFNYPNTKNNVKSNNVIKLVTLKNTDNEIIGYANTNGMLYFKN